MNHLNMLILINHKLGLF